MAHFGQRFIILSLCLLATVINSEQRLQNDSLFNMSEEICSMYMQDTSRLLDKSQTFNMLLDEFGWDSQNGNTLKVTELFQRTDWDHEGYLNFRECAMFIRRWSKSIR